MRRMKNEKATGFLFWGRGRLLFGMKMVLTPCAMKEMTPLACYTLVMIDV